VVLFVLESGCKPHVTASLPGHLVSILLQQPEKLEPTYVPGDSQAGMTSSLTIWRRIIAGLSSSKWQRTASRIIVLSSSRVAAWVNMPCPRALAVNPPPIASSSTRNIISFSICLPYLQGFYHVFPCAAYSPWRFKSNPRYQFGNNVTSN